MKEIKVPYHYQWKYYYHKFPLYMKGNVKSYENLFSYVEKFYIELEKFDIPYKTILRSMINDGAANKKLSESVIKASHFQNKLLDKFNELNSTITKPKYDLFYYRLLAHILTISPLQFKNDWRNFLNLFDLRYHVKIVQNPTTKKLILQIDESLDTLTKWVFQDLAILKRFERVEVAKVFDEDAFNKLRSRVAYFEHAFYDNAYYYNESPNDIKIIFEEQYE